MLLGEYKHAIDPKKRIALPAKFRKHLGKNIVITRGLDHCLFVYALAEWQGVAEKLSRLPMGQADTRSFGRFMLAGAIEVQIDSMGRMLIPDFLKDFANLKNHVVVAGVHSRVEIWNEDAWEEYKKKVEGQADALAEKLGDVGVF
jgi:MraZ protein